MAFLVPLSQGLYALIDDEDAPAVLPFKWTAQRAKQTFYAYRWDRSGSRPRKVYLHRQIMNEPPALVDHQDRDGLNCVRSNMRVATHAQNRSNARRNGRSGATGVVPHRRKWGAYIKDGARRLYLGSFSTRDEAAEAYRAAALARYGEFAP